MRLLTSVFDLQMQENLGKTRWECRSHPFQLPPTWQKDAPRLRAFLALLPPEHRVAFEFRHPSWFDDEVFGLLREHRATLCIADAEDDLEVPVVATAAWGCLRLRRPEYNDAALKKWVKQMRNQDWQDAFVFFKHEDEGKGPQLAKRFLELAGQVHAGLVDCGR